MLKLIKEKRDNKTYEGQPLSSEFYTINPTVIPGFGCPRKQIRPSITHLSCGNLNGAHRIIQPPDPKRFIKKKLSILKK